MTTKSGLAGVRLYVKPEGMVRYAGKLLPPCGQGSYPPVGKTRSPLGHFWCSVVTLVILSSNLNNNQIKNNHNKKNSRRRRSKKLKIISKV